MRIIAGTARGTALKTLPGTDVTRPTVARVKEGMFSAVQFLVPGARVLDAFAGSGQLGLEALSRGAASCVFLDESRAACAVVRENAAAARLAERARVLQTSAGAYLAACPQTFHLILLAPPYRRGTVAAILPAAARALAPFAGHYAEALFAIGLIAASFLAACVLPLTTAFVICEAFGWEAGVSFKWREAPTFKSIFTFVIAFSAIVVLTPDVNLLGMMLTAQFVNGVILPILLALMAIISADKYIMGDYRSGRVSKVLLWATVGVVAALTVALLVMQVLGLA